MASVNHTPDAAVAAWRRAGRKRCDAMASLWQLLTRRRKPAANKSFGRPTWALAQSNRVGLSGLEASIRRRW